MATTPKLEMHRVMKKKVLFVTYGGGHVNMIIPIVKALKKNPYILPIVLGLTTAKEELDRAGIESFTMHDFLDPKNETARLWGEQLTDESVHARIPYTESVAYLGLNYKELIATYGKDKAAKLYAEKGRHAFLPVKLMRDIIGELSPDLVVTTNSPRSERAAIMAAGELNIPSLCMIDLFAHHGEWIWKKNFATKVCVFSDQVKKHLIKNGRKADDIVITGNPAYDMLFSHELSDQAERLRIKKNWRNGKVLLWASQPEPKRHPFTQAPGDPTLPRRIDDYLIKTISRYPEWHLVIRPHPSENTKYENLPPHVSVSESSEPLFPLLKAVDAIAVLSSTVGIQAALMNKSVFQIHGSMFYKDLPMDTMGYAIPVPNLFDFENVFFKAPYKAPKRFAQVEATPVVVRVILELLQAQEFKDFTADFND